MNVEYTGRQCEITPAIRKEVETRLTKIRKILGNRFETKVILVVEKHRHKAEITIKPRNGPLVGIAQARDMASSLSGLPRKRRWPSSGFPMRRTARNSGSMPTATVVSPATSGTNYLPARSRYRSR